MDFSQGLAWMMPPHPESTTPDISVIVPVWNDPLNLRECLAALKQSSYPCSEIIVVDDASTDDTASVAAQMGVHVLRVPKNMGPAAARNYGARYARGDILFFVDADVAVAPDAMSRVARTFKERPRLAAVFGSYDARPRGAGIVSQYRNLLHHFVHQQGKPEASTFWAGCGAMRQSVFDEIGGFDEKRFPRPSIEDIELGCRLRRAGYHIVLDKGLQGTHLKKWTLWSMIRTDVTRRAIPWSRLILEGKQTANDLNVKGDQRLSATLVGLAGVLLPLAAFRVELLAPSVAALLAVGFLNRELYSFFVRQRGVRFGAACIPLHLLYYGYSGLSFLCVWIDTHLRRFTTRLGRAV